MEQIVLDPGLKLEGHHWDLLRLIFRKRASFLSEMASELGYSEYNLKTYLFELRKEELIEHIKPDFNTPQPELAVRVPEMSNIGQGGYAKFCQKRWFRLTPQGLSRTKKVIE